MNKQRVFSLLISVFVLGILSGLVAGILGFFMDWIAELFLAFNETNKMPVAVNATSFRRLLSPILASLLSSLIWFLIRRQKKIPKISQVIEGEKMPFIGSVAHIFNQLLYVGAGGSVGRELAPREFATLLAEKWQRLLTFFKLDYLTAEDKRLLIASAAGAGFAGAYLSPLTGMFFCIEILYKKISKKSIAISLTMSLIAMQIGILMKGNEPYYLLGLETFSSKSFLLTLFLSPLLGLLAAFFRRSFLWAERNQSKDKKILWQLPLAALLTGFISMLFPQIMGNGRGLAQLSFNAESQELIVTLLLIALLKGPVTVMTIRAGAAGGTLTPSISMGASLGASLVLVFPILPVWQGAMIGAVAFLSAAQQAPLMALFMMLEISHLPLSSVAPLALSACLSLASSQMILKKL
ncbi:MAG: chloride channel protein [Lactovum sp.]